MMRYIQETDSKMIVPIPDELNYPFLENHKNQTYGGALLFGFYQISFEANFADKALEFLKNTERTDVSIKANEVLRLLQQKVETLLKYGITSYLPKINGFSIDDGSILLEWIFEDFRIGFSIENNGSESSWYLVSTKKYGEINASGYISDHNFENIILWLLNFVLVNS
jgi:hypothetical protein